MSLRVKVCGVSGELCSVAVEQSWEVCKVKQAIEAAAAIPAREQRLFASRIELSEGALAKALLASSAPAELTLVRRAPEQARWLEEVRRARFLENPLREAPEDIRADREVVLAAVRRLPTQRS